MPTNNGNSTIARKYREQYGWEMPTLKLARIMYKENKESFKDIETARGRLRYIEGKYGKNSPKAVVKRPDRPKNPYNLPSSDESVYEPYVLKAKRVLLLSDIHVPYHSIDALTACFNSAKKEKPDAVVLNGDTIDMFMLSRFEKNPKARSFAHELATFQQLFERLQNIFKAKIYFKLGNHEERYNHFLWMKAGELDGVDEFSLENIIKARAEGIEVIGDKRKILAGGLTILHGHEIPNAGFGPVNIARGLFNKAFASSIQGHNHRTSEHSEQDLHGKLITTWSTGCLCDLHPAYMPINRWNHGYALIDVDKDKFHVRNKRIYKGEIV